MQRARIVDKFVLGLGHRRVADARRYTSRSMALVSGCEPEPYEWRCCL
jgi:hypothetical protein